ncbi:MAG: STM4014 family protein [Myxococcota bacterium]
MDPRTFIVIGNPENRRVEDFVSALRARGISHHVFAHRDLLQDTAPLRALPDTPAWVRLESIGEDADVEKTLLRRGLPASEGRTWRTLSAEHIEDFRFGEVTAPRQLHLGVESYFRSLADVFDEKTEWRQLQPIEEVLKLFDKRVLSDLYAGAGLATPINLGPVESPNHLREVMSEGGIASSIVKVSCASSASGLIAFKRGSPGVAMSTLERAGDRWFNSLRMRRYSKGADVDHVLQFVLNEGAQVEKLMPKAKFQGLGFDFRVLTIQGEPVFAVMRQSRHPITNLHLGGSRGDIDAFRAAHPEAMESVEELARRVAAQHRSFHLGVDIMLDRNMSTARVIESNAFGDLLPGLTRDGMSVYEYQVDCLLQGP